MSASRWPPGAAWASAAIGLAAWNTDAERAGALERIDQARRQFEQRRAEAAAWDVGR